MITFLDDQTGKAKRALVQVKSGHVKHADIRDLRGTVDREQAELGVFITLEESTKPMVTEAVAAGSYHSAGWSKDYPRLQILTVAELLDGAEVKLPPTVTTFKQAQKATDKAKAGKAQTLWDQPGAGYSVAADRPDDE